MQKKEEEAFSHGDQGLSWGHVVAVLGCPPDPQPGLGRCQGPDTEARAPRTPAPLSVSVNVVSGLRPGKASWVLGSPYHMFMHVSRALGNPTIFCP